MEETSRCSLALVTSQDPLDGAGGEAKDAMEKKRLGGTERGKADKQKRVRRKEEHDLGAPGGGGSPSSRRDEKSYATRGAHPRRNSAQCSRKKPGKAHDSGP